MGHKHVGNFLKCGPLIDYITAPYIGGGTKMGPFFWELPICWGSGLRAQECVGRRGLRGTKGQSLGCRASGFRVWVEGLGLGFRVQCSAFRV